MLKRFLSSEPRLKEQSDAQTCVSRLVKSPSGELDFLKQEANFEGATATHKVVRVA